jgi:hypothetical protein
MMYKVPEMVIQDKEERPGSEEGEERKKSKQRRGAKIKAWGACRVP